MKKSRKLNSGPKKRQRVKCNILVKQYTLNSISKLTNMSIGEVYDNYREKKSVLSKTDSETIDALKQLKDSVKNMIFPDSANKKFNHHLELKAKQITTDIDEQISFLAKGFEPIHCRDLFDFANLDLIGDNIHTRIHELRAFKEILTDWTAKIHEGTYDVDPSILDAYPDFYKQHENPGVKTNFVHPKYRYEQFLKSFPEDRLKDMISHITPEVLVASATNGFDDLNINDDECEKEKYEELNRKYRESQFRLILDSYYCFTSKFDKVDSEEFRDIVEFIAYIPSRSEPMNLWNIMRATELLNDLFLKKKNFILKNWSSNELKNYGKLNSTFNFKEIESFFRGLSSAKWYCPISIDHQGMDLFLKYLEEPDNVMVSGICEIGMDINFKMYIPHEEIKKIKREVNIVKGHKDSTVLEKRQAYLMFKKYRLDFLLRYTGHYVLDSYIQTYANFDNGYTILFDTRLEYIKILNQDDIFYNGRFLHSYDIYEITEDGKYNILG